MWSLQKKKMKDAKSKDSKQDPKSQKDLETTKEKRKEKAKPDINLDQLPFQDGIISSNENISIFLLFQLTSKIRKQTS